MTTTISVIVPAYNQEGLVSFAVDSILAQRHPAHEIIVVDDGSTDRTGEVVRRMAQDHPSVVYVHQSNAGPGAARNKGIERATGEWIAFLDADDLWVPDKLSRAVAAIEAQPQLDFLQSNRRHLRGDGTIDDGLPVSEKDMRDRNFLLGGFLIKTSAVMIRRTVLEGIGGLFPTTQRTCEDYDLFWRAVMHAREIGFLASCDSVIRELPQSLSRGNAATYLIRDNLRTLASVTRWAEAHGHDVYLPTLRRHRYWQYYELFVLLLHSRELRGIGGCVRQSIREQGGLPTLRALASAAASSLHAAR